jgi:hypothetical protein
VSPVKYNLGLYISEDDILHSHRRENLKYYMNRRTFKISSCNCESNIYLMICSSEQDIKVPADCFTTGAFLDERCAP